jgi:tRNA A-37 threonylcarbamoyl transferase component Bud32
VIGFLLEKAEGRRAGIADLEICQRSLQRLHDLGVLHGDVNRHNFIIAPGHEAVPIGFEKSVINADVESLAKEMSGLAEQLSEETGRGGGFFAVE